MPKTKVRNKKEKETLKNPIAEIALYFGFSPTDLPAISKEDEARLKTFQKQILLERHSHAEAPAEIFNLSHKISALRMCMQEAQSANQPAMLFFNRKTKPYRDFSLEIIGSHRSVAEALLIKTGHTILKEDGLSNIHVVLNSIGEKDSTVRFEREISNYYKKKLGDVPSKCREAIKKHPLCFNCQHEGCLSIRREAPQSLGFLSEQGRIHFKEVLEFIDHMNIPYSIDNDLLGNKDFFSNTLFEIHAEDKSGQDKVHAFGFRYTPLSKKIGFRRDIPAVGLSFAYNPIKNPEIRHVAKDPKFYFIHLGFEAKLKSIEVIDMLRRCDIPVVHSLAKDKITGQLFSAENMNLPFIIIMGQKEAVENTVVVRSTVSRVQEIVNISELPIYLKRIAKTVK